MSENGNLSVHPVNGLPPAPILLRAKQISALLGIGVSTWWEWQKIGRVPKGIKISRRITVWKKDDVLAMIDRLACPETK